MKKVTPIEYVGRKFALQTNEGKIIRVGKILSEFTFLNKKYFAVKANSVRGNMNLQWSDVSMRYLHRNNIIFLPKEYPLTYMKLIHYDKKGNELKRGKLHLSHSTKRVKLTY